MTFDVEDWYQALDIPAERWSSFERRLSVGLEFILESLAAQHVRATFFVLGVVANEHPAWVQRIADAGHEIGTHGWSHTPIYRQTPDQFRSELCRSRNSLQDLIGQHVSGHRAAMFSITRRSRWALDQLAEAGFVYDSSIFPVHNYRYGIPHANRFPHTITTPVAAPQSARSNGRCAQLGAGALWEIPISTLRLSRSNLPLGGGFYMRFYPYRLLRWAIRLLNRKGKPAVVYFHPWEFDAQQPHVSRESYWLARATHYYRLSSTRATLRRLLNDFQWMSVQDYLKVIC